MQQSQSTVATFYDQLPTTAIALSYPFLLQCIAGLAQEIEDAVLRAMRREPGKDLIRQLIKLLFLMNLKPASYSSNSEEYRGPALRAYQVGKDELVLCQISDRYFPAKDVKAAHILRLEWSPIAVSAVVSCVATCNCVPSG